MVEGNKDINQNSYQWIASGISYKPSEAETKRTRTQNEIETI
jgi:hypothetical protein